MARIARPAQTPLPTNYAATNADGSRTRRSVEPGKLRPVKPRVTGGGREGTTTVVNRRNSPRRAT